MIEYVCYNSECRKSVGREHIERRIRCPYCSSKILIKKRTIEKTIKAH